MITIYGASWCSFCRKAKALCEDFGLVYEWKDVDDPEIYNELSTKIENFKTVPQIYWDHKYIGGYSDLIMEIENHNIGNYGQGKF